MTHNKITTGLLAAAGLAATLLWVWPSEVDVDPAAVRGKLAGTWYNYAKGSFGSANASERLQIIEFPGTATRLGAAGDADGGITGDVNLATYIDKDLDFYDMPTITSRLSGNALYRVQAMETGFTLRGARIDIITGEASARTLTIVELEPDRMVLREGDEDLVLIREPAFMQATTAQLAQWFAL